jgi:monofunctional glycosyltransferase
MGKGRTRKQKLAQVEDHDLGAVRPTRMHEPDEAPPAALAAVEPAAGTRTRRWRLFRNFALVCVAIGMVPAVLGIVYRIEPVRPVSTLMLGRWLLLQPVERRWVEIEDVAPIAWQSIIMSEDGQFCAHHGIDLRELNAVIDDAMEGEKTRGASTITMQLAKNLFLWNGRSILRKIAELPLAVYIDVVLPKKRIMEIYLNIAEWDVGVFGIEAAAQHYFNRPASKLSARQAALLAVTLPAPGVRNPAKPGRGLQRLASIIERRAARSGGYTGCIR